MAVHQFFPITQSTSISTVPLREQDRVEQGGQSGYLATLLEKALKIDIKSKMAREVFYLATFAL
jgi:hypothetical protein